MARTGKYRNLRGNRSVEQAHGRVNSTVLDTAVFTTIDLVLEGQAALIQAIQWDLNMENSEFAAETDVQQAWVTILSMDTDLNTAGFITTLGVTLASALDDEDTIGYKIATKEGILAGVGASFQASYKGAHYFDDYSGFGGILVPESLRLVGVQTSATAVDTQHDVMIYYERIEKPETWMKDYLYRRR